MASSIAYPGVEVGGSRKGPRGRCLKATKDFEPGELIAVFTSPLLAVGDAAHRETTCTYCLSEAPVPLPGVDAPVFKLRACTGCHAARYCSPACQKADWALVHGKECKALQRVRDRTGKDWLPTPVRALLQVLIRRNDALIQAAFTSDGPLGLEGNVAHFRTVDGGKLWSDMQLQAVAAAVYAGLGEGPEMVTVATEILCKIHTNAFDRADLDSDQAGIFLEPTLAMVNHSCLPNAFVGFDKRTAILRAEQAIQSGEEILISYIDSAMPKAARAQHLKLYHFDCQCGRCTEDLDVYQVCRASPLLPLNRLSLVPSTQVLRDPPLDSARYSELSKRRIEQMYADSQAIASRGIDRLRERWRLCQPLVEAGMWATEPLSQTLVETAIMFHSERGNHAYALSVACFAATLSDPFAAVAPFRPSRVKRILMTARLLAITAKLTATNELSQAVLRKELVTTLQQCDQATMCEALLLIVLRWGPLAHSDDWLVVRMAQAMMADVRMLAGRDKESGLLQAWADHPDRQDDAKSFFESQVLGPIQRLAGFAPELLAAELGGPSKLLE